MFNPVAQKLKIYNILIKLNTKHIIYITNIKLGIRIRYYYLSKLFLEE